MKTDSVEKIDKNRLTVVKNTKRE